MADNYNMDDEDEGGGSEWLATYGDLVTLLLCFFVLLYSMSVIDSAKFKQAAESLNNIGIMLQTGSINPTIGDSIADLDVYSAKSAEDQMNHIYKEVKDIIDSGGLTKDVEVKKVDKGVLLRFKNEILFDIAQADLKQDAKNNLSRLGKVLRKHNKIIKVEGHTDNIPISNSEYRSNWELSTARAISVVRYFTEELPSDQRLNPKSFEVSGYGEYHPIAPNNTEENKQKNRRIEITISQ
ncbi:chemotaxis protein MotB [Clostridium pascui]|uniref:flagellar motor protein MotB n=1 Tax=Clostridium pascui TaxID=46609 RepID=UPI0019568B5C|nr:chemotaxis protein MotB [Clostridium pascui]